MSGSVDSVRHGMYAKCDLSGAEVDKEWEKILCLLWATL